MSYQAPPTMNITGSTGTVEMVIESINRDLGGFSVRRVLPSDQLRMVGPFVFFDHMGPAEFPPGQGIQVRPHPHIGLSTVTYLFEGEIIHRDSLGYVQPIRAGAVNLMTAGRGIVHSERAGEDIAVTSRLHGIQTWMALPLELEEMAPGFIHYGAAELPDLEVNGVKVRVIIGEAYGLRSPVLQHSPTLYLDCRLPAGASLALPTSSREMAVYVVAGEVVIDGHICTPGAMAKVRPELSPKIDTGAASHVMVVGGDPLGPRIVWWNLVSSSRERIEKTKVDWKEQRFDRIPGETEFIPLPE